MPALSAVRRAIPLALLLPTLAALSACAPGRDEFAPACPEARLLPPTGDIVLYRANSSGRDVTDQVLRGRVVGINGQCRNGDKGQLNVQVSVSFEFNRGPAMQGEHVVVPVFIAVTEGERILDKRIYGVDAAFPPNVQQVRRTSDPLTLSLPVGPDRSGAAYTVLAGFQLTPDQLATSRGR